MRQLAPALPAPSPMRLVRRVAPPLLRLLADLPALLRPRGMRGPQTREIDTLSELFRRVKAAQTAGDYGPVEEMVDPEAVLRTREGEQRGRAAVIEHLKKMGERRYRAQIVAPKGGLVTVLIVPLGWEGTNLGRGHEQTYRLLHDQLVELIDLGRTPDMVYRPESQPF